MGNSLCCDKQIQEDKKIKTTLITKTNNQTSSTPQSTKNLKSSVEKQEKSRQKKRGYENYQAVRYLGCGTFGKVVLAEDKNTLERYAMKIIDKNKIKQFNVMQCKLIQQIENKNFLVPIRQTFQNKNFIYIIMEYLPKGDIYFYLRKKQVKFTEDIIRGIVAQIVIGVEFLHKCGIIYRELKPENILVTADGHIKLTDYGLSKVIVNQKQFIQTFVGTLEYMPPEALNGSFGQKADIWAIGVLMYELWFQTNPFEEDSNEKIHIQNDAAATHIVTIEEKLNSNIGYLSQNFRDLLLALLQNSPEKRITLQQIKIHPFFKSVDWTQIADRRNEGPLKNFIENNQNIKYQNAETVVNKRRMFSKNRGTNQYKINLYQFRNSH